MTDIQKAEKKFCENISVAFTKEFFAMALKSGEDSDVYALTPGHMKRLAQYTVHQVAEFEKKHGEIVTEAWSPDIKSPLQINKPEDK